ncbi:MAG: DUF429 domain-containing protein [Butyrivibrio sp.]|nr:DUF429 domain-containing protein [Butyrivibrio sp.]
MDNCKVLASEEGIYIGVDGCKNGWIVAVINFGRLKIEKYGSMTQIIESYPTFNQFLIDMAIGLQESANDLRPDTAARKMIKPRSSTIFPVPSRQAVYKDNEMDQKNANMSVLKKSLAKQSMAIIPKIRELDIFLDKHPGYKNVICESHPELCFARLNNQVVMSKKKDIEGINERIHILSKYIDVEGLKGIRDYAKTLYCKPDDILDAICLAVTASMKDKGQCETVPDKPCMDARGLFMQMVIPNLKVKMSI